MRWITALVALLLPLVVSAASLTWVNPTAFTDNSPLVPADIASTLIEWSNTSPFSTVAGSQVVTGAAQAATAPDPAAGGVRCYRASTKVVAAKGGGTSAPSNVSCKTVAFPNPSPPTSFTVTDPVAYEIRQSGSQLVASRVGRVEVGTLCTNEAQTVSGVKYNRVDMRVVDLVVWPSASPSTVKAWARCG